MYVVVVSRANVSQNATRIQKNLDVLTAVHVQNVVEMKITKKTRISELIEGTPQAEEILIKAGMHCVGCPMAQQETIEEGCRAHGMSDDKINELVRRFN